jgi:hypothetical protein
MIWRPCGARHDDLDGGHRGGRFYDVRSPNNSADFYQEAAVILKSAIFEEPFKPQVVAASELIRGISGAEMPPLLVMWPPARSRARKLRSFPKMGDPILAHWQFWPGPGRLRSPVMQKPSGRRNG